MKSLVHMSQSITGPLRNWTPKQWNQAVEYITNDDGSQYASGKALKAEFQRLADCGIECVPIGKCDNFDYKHGCMGHPVKGAK
jgi:hypothetical protein